MKITTGVVQKLTIGDIPDQDPISVYLEDLGPRRGKVTITCFDDSWSYFWGAIGKGETIQSFFLRCDNHYLAGKFSPGLDPEEVYLDNIVEYTRKEILKKRRQGELDKETARKHWNNTEDLDGVLDLQELVNRDREMMYDVFGDEWFFHLPQRPNPKYEYLCRIISTIKEALLNQDQMIERRKQLKNSILEELARRWKLEPEVGTADPKEKGHREAKRECADTLTTLIGIFGEYDQHS